MYLMDEGYTNNKYEPQESQISWDLNMFITLQAWLYFQEICTFNYVYMHCHITYTAEPFVLLL